MRLNRLIPAALLALGVACNENSPNPVDNNFTPEFGKVHFINSATGTATLSAITGGTGGELTVSFKIAGLGDNETITVTLTADAIAEYGCQNNGGQFPDAANKQQVQGPVTASGPFTSGQNGQITGSLTLSPPAATSFCPPGQHEVLLSVSYSNVSIDAGGLDSFAVSGTFSTP